MKKHILRLTCIATLLMLSSCNPDLFYSDDHDVNAKGWNLYNPERFEIEITDTAQFYNFFVDLRLSDNYPYSNLFLFITTTFPDGSIARDTVECPVADAQGQWYGKHSGTIVDCRYPLCRKVRFPNSGTYHFDIVHGMRDADLEGVRNIGLRLEKFEH